MLLTDLHPEFIRATPRPNGTDGGIELCKRLQGAEGAGAQGIIFDCPTPGHSEKLIVWFENPIGGGAPAPSSYVPTPRWHRSGETFDTLSLNPSILSYGDWHGWIRNGEVTNA